MEVASAVRLPSPGPEVDGHDVPRKRERSPYDGPSSGPSKRSRRDEEDDGDADGPDAREEERMKDVVVVNKRLRLISTNYVAGKL